MQFSFEDPASFMDNVPIFFFQNRDKEFLRKTIYKCFFVIIKN